MSQPNLWSQLFRVTKTKLSIQGKISGNVLLNIPPRELQNHASKSPIITKKKTQIKNHVRGSEIADDGYHSGRAVRGSNGRVHHPGHLHQEGADVRNTLGQIPAAEVSEKFLRGHAIATDWDFAF